MSVRVASESQHFRLVTGTTHNILGAIPAKGCLPLPDAKTGTITSDPASAGADNKKIVFGTGTFFLDEVHEGDYIYAVDVCRRVMAVTSNSQLILDYPFPSIVSAVALKVVRHGKYRRITANSTGSADAIYQEAAFKAAAILSSANEMGLAPISYDASTLNAAITFDLSE